VDPDHLPDGYQHYRELEHRAKSQKLGLWANPSVSPRGP
jgi:endonuclease YncB( thermonuclease family)